VAEALAKYPLSLRQRREIQALLRRQCGSDSKYGAGSKRIADNSAYFSLLKSRVSFAAGKDDLAFCYRQYLRVMEHSTGSQVCVARSARSNSSWSSTRQAATSTPSAAKISTAHPASTRPEKTQRPNPPERAGICDQRNGAPCHVGWAVEGVRRIS